MLNCNMMTRSLCCVSIEVRDLPTYDGLSEVDAFLDKFKSGVPEKRGVAFNTLSCHLD